MADQALPLYLQAADNHNWANGRVSWLSPDTWTEKLGNIGKYGATSMLSGANSFYNTGASVGNFFGLDIQQNDTSAFISSLDSDLGQYYRGNQEAVDLGGFVLGSLVPGLGGIKIFNAGQRALVAAKDTGFIGGNLARATGLLVPKTQEFVKLATADMNASATSLKLLNANTSKALASGLWQNTLEAAAFETAVQVTMFKSPILEQQDVGDIVSNIAVGGLLGGAVGGIFEGVKIWGGLKQAAKVEDAARFPFIERPSFASRTPGWEKITALAYDTEAAAVPVILKSPTGDIVNNYAVNLTLYTDKVRKNFNEIRTETNALATDNEIGNIMANMMSPIVKDGKYAVNFSQNYLDAFSGAVKITRPLEESAIEIAARQAIAKGEVPKIPIGTRYVKLFGEDAGNTLASRDGILLSLGDVHAGEEAIKKVVRAEKFSAKFDGSDTWSALTLKGVNAHTTAEKRYIWAAKESGLLKEVPEGATVSKYDIPVLERAFLDGQFRLKVVSGEGPSLEVINIGSRDDLYRIIKESKEETAAYLGQRQQRGMKESIPFDQGTDAIAKITNTRVSYLENAPSTNEFNDLFASQAAHGEYLRSLGQRDLSMSANEVKNPIFLPKYAKVVYELSEDIAGAAENIGDAVVYLKQMQKLYQQGSDRVVSKIAGKYSEMLPALTDKAMLTASRTGSGAGLVSGENSNYGSLGSFMAQIGTVTRAMKQEFRKLTGDNLEGSLVSLGRKQEAAFEFESLNQKISRQKDLFVVRENTLGEHALVSRRIAKEFDDPTSGAPGIVDYEALEEGVSAFTIKHPETLNALRAHIDETGKRTSSFREIHGQQGLTDLKDSEVFRPIRPDLKAYPHFAFVVDPKVTGSGHMTMIHAASEKELAALMDKVPSTYKVVTKTDTEEFFKARGEYEHSRTLNENYLNSDLVSQGVFSNFFPKSDPQKIIDDVLQQNYRESDTLVTETIRLKYESQFGMLEDFGKQYSKVDTSRFASRADLLEKTSNNPYFNYIKTALDISKISEYPLIFGFNKMLDEATSKAVGAIKQTFFSKVKTQADLDIINSQLDEFGMKPAYYDAALQALSNHSAPRGELTKFVRHANSLLSLFTLGLDPLNSLNNAIGSNILRLTELKHLTKAIAAGDTEIAGELGNIAKVSLPGIDDQILSPSKLVGKAIQNFWKDEGVLVQKYKDAGYIVDRVEQLKLLVDDFTLKGTETVADLNRRMSAGFERAKGLAEAGEKATGNKLAEEFNRFISANVMDQITSIAVSKGLMDEKAAKAYINTFVNRVEGNVISTQRPLIFQGPIGQAIGLFQSYQFNLLQQLFRYVAEGSKKDIATLAGLQSTLYGIQSLPAFQFLNVHILGQLSGNTEHRDAYDAVYGTVGRTAGDFMLYGIPSNILQTNIYSRGDINPRQITVLPTSLQEIPIVQGWGKFLSSVKDTLVKTTQGAPVWETLLQGMEHNGISRPLAGFAQTLQATGPGGQAYSTSSKGSILYSNDLLSWATLSRLSGGRPLDEAITNDALFRVKSYQTARQADMQSLAEKVKLSLIQGNEPSSDALNNFAEQYAKLGGKQAGFNKWMMSLYKNANVSQAEQLQASLTNPFAYKMQLLMGGENEE